MPTTEGGRCHTIEGGGHTISEGGHQINTIQQSNVSVCPPIDTPHTPTIDTTKHADAKKYGVGGTASPDHPPHCACIIAFPIHAVDCRSTPSYNSIQ